MTKRFDDKEAFELMNTQAHEIRDQILSWPGGVNNGTIVAGHKIQQLAGWLYEAQQRVKQLMEIHNHNEEWRKTYRAALTGCFSTIGDAVDDTWPTKQDCANDMHEMATLAANNAHGPLQELPKKEG